MQKSFTRWIGAALLLAAAGALAQPAQVDRSTSCGAPARGYKADGSGDVATLTAQQASGLRVNGEGVWEACQVTPSRACGQGGTGYMAGRGIVDLLPEEAGRWKTDSAGAWVECSACLPAAQQAFRAWSSGPSSCTTARTHDSDPNSRARDRVLGHGESYVWSQWIGAMRGQLIEACHDGRRTVVAATCRPATGCDHNIEAWRGNVRADGRQTLYSYQAAGAGREVPNGATVTLRGDDGSTWPATCDAGEWSVPNVLPPKQPEPTPPRVKLTGCASQTFSARIGLQALSYWRYSGGRVPTGTAVDVTSTSGAEARQAVCGPNGRLTLQ